MLSSEVLIQSDMRLGGPVIAMAAAVLSRCLALAVKMSPVAFSGSKLYPISLSLSRSLSFVAQQLGSRIHKNHEAVSLHLKLTSCYYLPLDILVTSIEVVDARSA